MCVSVGGSNEEGGSEWNVKRISKKIKFNKKIKQKNNTFAFGMQKR